MVFPLNNSVQKLFSINLKQALLLILILNLCAATYSQNCEQEWQRESYFIPEPFIVQGQATRSLSPEIAIIQPSAETLEKEATLSLQKNQEIIQKAIQMVKQNNRVLESEITTNSFTISPSYKSVYNQRSQNYDTVFEGYQTSNTILIRTAQLNLTGQIIDTLIKAGMNRINSVTFDVKASTKEKVLNELTSEAIQNAKKQATLALDELGMEIKSIKSITLNDQYAPVYQRAYSYAKIGGVEAMDDASMAGDDTIFSNQITLKKQVTISFLIGKKE